MIIIADPEKVRRHRINREDPGLVLCVCVYRKLCVGGKYEIMVSDGGLWLIHLCFFYSTVSMASPWGPPV